MADMRVRDAAFGARAGLGLVAGPCAMESLDGLLRVAKGVREVADALAMSVVFKASFDKANRTRHDSYRGPGLATGIAWLAEARRVTGMAVTTDVHEPSQVGPVSQVADLLQIPAFLCRQTDLLIEAGRTGLPVNLKKGQFVAPRDMAHAVDKVRHGGSRQVMVTERGTCFGYGDLVVDMRSIAVLRELDVVVGFDATHSTQRPGGGGGHSTGDRAFAPVLARAAVAAGAQVLFVEVHADPSQALSDAETQWPLADLKGLLESILPFYSAKP